MILSWFTGGTLDRILETIDKRMDNETEREKVKGEVTKTYIQAQANLAVGRTWWFQLFFVVPLGLWWTSVILDSIFMWNHKTAALPSPLILGPDGSYLPSSSSMGLRLLSGDLNRCEASKTRLEVSHERNRQYRQARRDRERKSPKKRLRDPP